MRSRIPDRSLVPYVNKTALGEQRLLGYDGEGRIRLNCQDSKTGRWHTVTLEVDEFLRRWCLHVLPKGLVRVRHYGFLSPAAKKKLERLHRILGTQPQPKPAPLEPPKPQCPCCGKPMTLLREIPRPPREGRLHKCPPRRMRPARKPP